MFWLITLKRGTLWKHQHRLVPFNITIERFSVLHATLAMSHLLKVTRTKLPRSVFVPCQQKSTRWTRTAERLMADI